MDELKVTLVQTALHWEKADENLLMLEGIIRPLKNSTDLIVLPEMFSTGFSMRAAELAEGMDGTAVEWMRQMARETGAVITGSLIIREEDKYYNRMIWMRPDGSREHYDKRHLFSMGKEHQYYSRGRRRLVVGLNGWNLCPLVCYDLRFPEWCRNTTHSKKTTSDESPGPYDVLIFVANWPERRNFAWKYLLQARAIENQSYVVAVNRIGNDGNGIYHSGDSAVVDPMGEVVFTEADIAFTKTVTLSKERLEFVRSSLPFLADRDELDIEI